MTVVVIQVTELLTKRLPDGRRELLADLVVEVLTDGDERRFVVPAGFVTDYSSIPWAARRLVHWSRVDVAGVVHDWLYAEAPLSRKVADWYWREIARGGDHGANVFQAWVGWAGLRIGGWAAWRQHRRRG